jgi:hypothetical protein
MSVMFIISYDSRFVVAGPCVNCGRVTLQARVEFLIMVASERETKLQQIMIMITDHERGTQGMNKLFTVCKFPEEFHLGYE